MGGGNIKFNKLFLCLVAFLFLISVTASFALDDNATDVSLNDDNVEVSDSNDVLTSTNDDIVSVDYSYIAEINSSSIHPGKVTKRYNGGIEYSATFLDENGTPMKDTIVYCGVDGIAYGVDATTNDKGVAFFLLPLQKGAHQLSLTEAVTPAIKVVDVNVFDVLTGGKDYNLYFNSGKYYTLRVFGDDGKPVKANQKVTFTINAKKTTVKTDSKGYAKLKISFQPGTYLVTATYKNFVVANKIIVKPTIIPLTQFGAKKLSKTFKYKVKLLNNKGKILKYKKVKVKFNKKTYTAKTDKKGIATFTLKTPLKTGKYNVVSTYGKAKATAQFTRYVIR